MKCIDPAFHVLFVALFDAVMDAYFDFQLNAYVPPVCILVDQRGIHTMGFEDPALLHEFSDSAGNVLKGCIMRSRLWSSYSPRV